MWEMTGARVLLVEDMALLLLDLEDLVTELGLRVAATASTIEDGIGCARTHELDVAILDVDLAGKRSTPIAEILADRGVPIVFVTGFADAELPQRFEQYPRLPKPFADSQLREALSAAGRMRRQRRAPGDPSVRE
jgi:CheY-like chemotaxis protein